VSTDGLPGPFNAATSHLDAGERRGLRPCSFNPLLKGTLMKRIVALMISGLVASTGALAQETKMAAPAPAAPAAAPAPTTAAPAGEQPAKKKQHKKKQHKKVASTKTEGDATKADAKKSDMKPAAEPMAKPMAPADTKK
jgi:hypothetical protein